MFEMQWQLEKESSNLPEGLMHTFMPKARIITFDEHTRCLVHLNLSEKVRLTQESPHKVVTMSFLLKT